MASESPRRDRHDESPVGPDRLPGTFPGQDVRKGLDQKDDGTQGAKGGIGRDGRDRQERTHGRAGRLNYYAADKRDLRPLVVRGAPLDGNKIFVWGPCGDGHIDARTTMISLRLGRCRRGRVRPLFLAGYRSAAGVTPKLQSDVAVSPITQHEVRRSPRPKEKGDQKPHPRRCFFRPKTAHTARRFIRLSRCFPLAAELPALLSSFSSN